MNHQQVLAAIDREISTTKARIMSLVEARDAVAALHGDNTNNSPRRVMSIAARKRISQAQRARWREWKRARAA